MGGGTSPTAAPQAAFEFGVINTHSSSFIETGTARARAPGAGDAAVAAVFGKTRVTWRTSTTLVTRALFDGTAATSGAVGTATAQNSTLKVGVLDAGFFPLTGAIGELIFAAAEWSDAQMNAVDVAMAARWA